MCVRDVCAPRVVCGCALIAYVSGRSVPDVRARCYTSAPWGAGRTKNGVLFHEAETVSVVCRPGGLRRVAEANGEVVRPPAGATDVEAGQRARARAAGCGLQLGLGGAIYAGYHECMGIARAPIK